MKLDRCCVRFDSCTKVSVKLKRGLGKLPVQPRPVAWRVGLGEVIRIVVDGACQHRCLAERHANLFGQNQALREGVQCWPRQVQTSCWRRRVIQDPVNVGCADQSRRFPSGHAPGCASAKEREKSEQQQVSHCVHTLLVGAVRWVGGMSGDRQDSGTAQRHSTGAAARRPPLSPIFVFSARTGCRERCRAIFEAVDGLRRFPARKVVGV